MLITTMASIVNFYELDELFLLYCVTSLRVSAMVLPCFPPVYLASQTREFGQQLSLLTSGRV